VVRVAQMVAWMPSIGGDQSRTRTERTCQNVASRGDDLCERVVEHPAIFVVRAKRVEIHSSLITRNASASDGVARDETVTASEVVMFEPSTLRGGTGVSPRRLNPVTATATAAGKTVMLIGSTSGRRQARWANTAASCTTASPIPAVRPSA